MTEPFERPDYIDHGGDLRLSPPFLCERALLRCFALSADREALLRLVSSTLHRAGANHLVPLSSRVLLVFAEIGRASAAVDGASVPGNGGWFRETDVAFWVPLVDERTGTRVSWFMPYVFVDNAYAMAAGRESLGFAKTLGRFQLPPLSSGDGLAVDTLHLARQRTGDQYAFSRILEVSPAAAAASETRSAIGVLRAIAALTPIHASPRGGRARIGPAATELAAFPRRREVPIVLLRQLRDVSDPARASVQEVIEAPARLIRIQRGGVLAGARTLSITPSDSHPIAGDLGLQSTHPIDAAWWTEIDFVVDKGRVISDTSRRPKRATRPQRVAILGGGLGSLSAALALTSEPGWQSRHEITIYQMGHRLGGKCASSRRLDQMARIEEHGLHVWFGSYAKAFRMLRRCYGELDRPAHHPLATWRDAFIPQENFYLRERTHDGLATIRLELPPRPGLPGDEGHDPDAEALRRVVPSVLETLSRELRRLARGLSGRLAARVLRAVASSNLSSADALARTRASLLHALGDDATPALLDIVDLSLTTLVGMVRDGALQSGLEVLDTEELSGWLRRHGAAERTLESGLVRAFYDLLLASEASADGGRDLAAGAALRAALFVLNGYRGAYLWKMSAGMGETVIAPIYEALRRRGVRFRFFHRVDKLGLSPDGNSVDRIELGIQARPKGADYEPLVDVGGIACWPHAPRYDELEGGDEHAASGADFESLSSAHLDVGRVTLERGRDFDVAVLGIPVAALPRIAAELSQRHQPWRTMLARVRTTATIGFQAWLAEDARALGRSTLGDLQGGDPGPLSTYADMSHLLATERWAGPTPARHIGYFCGPLAEGACPSKAAHDYLEEGARAVWPAAYRSGRFDWSLLVDPEGRAGSARLLAQYIRGNVEPSERYTLTVRGSTACRLAPDGSGVEHLYLAGDWVKNGLDVGCIEGAVRAGEACAAAIAARPCQPLQETTRPEAVHPFLTESLS